MKIKIKEKAAFAVLSIVFSLAFFQGVTAETAKANDAKVKIIVAEAIASEGAVEVTSPDAINATPSAITTTSPAISTSPAVSTQSGINDGDDEDITEIEVDDEFSVGGVYYIVTEIRESKIYVGVSGVVNDRATTVYIPKKVKAEGKEMIVTSIEEDSFSDMERLRKVVVNADIVKIGNDAFKDAAKFDRFVVKTAKLKKVGKNILKNVSKKLIIEVPKKSLSSYKKLFNNKGVKVKEIRAIRK